MDISDLYESSDAVALAEHVHKGDVRPGELLDEALRRVEALNPRLNAVTLLREGVARRLIEEGLPEGPLKGVPFLLKDLGAEAIDFPSNNGSKLFADTHYGQDSSIYARLRSAGLVTFGRTTSPEGGVGPTTESAVYGGPTRNPWNLDHTPGGSSGGAAAAVASGILPAAHGSDGGGSVRIPASSCGLFGFKATRARTPDGPYVGEGWAGMAIDGFLTRSVRDTAMLLDITQGPDLGAPYVAPPLEDSYRAALARRDSPLHIAFTTTTLTGEPIAPECRAAVEEAARLLESLGHRLEEKRPTADTSGMMAAWTKIVGCGTALSVESAVRRRGRPLGDDEIESVARTAIDYARTVSGADYLEAINKVHAYGREMAAFFQPYDILLTATLAEPPAKLGRFDHVGKDYVDYRMGPDGVFAYSPFTAAFNASGQPAASLPLHWTADGLPVGVHLAAAFGRDELLIGLCARIEEAAPWAARRPPVSAFRKS
ncbi:amidase/6-aminohexanoate-cyclic-dimer hydrolase [Angulomicrobium tetraedrale]|uniref:Indoleacetamide hydrolase n=1 Tax=Ancylobacter tetraedralis TaxID=217068 RepID=A0A839Z992_9HYPH|nr:amidase [Ancylobacter tetraedralis]MBB3771205.1 amidase/6-aminohexanoate-cyclic-dimer hydrolase [Ancylobacter tetraedralis]